MISPGSKLGHYEVLSFLGEGGMGRVYRAHDPRLRRDVAIKVLHAETIADETRRLRFVQEARAASALNHPNIVTIYEIDAVDGIDFIVMECISGKSLDRLIPQKGMRLGEVLKIATPIADALARAHAKGIVHRDLKPANVMLSDEGVVKVLDFGLAKLVQEEVSDDEETVTKATASGPLTHPGAIPGTAAYMSPEQATAGNIDSRSDVFSFGVMLYEMVTGRRAFAGASRSETLEAVITSQPKAPSEIVPNLPRDLEKVIQRCLRKEPDRRFQHMLDVKLELEQIKEDSSSGSLVSSVPRPRASARWLLVGIVGTLALIAVGLLIWPPPRPSEAPAAPRTILSILPPPGAAWTGWFALSPDGRNLALVGAMEGRTQIWIRSLGEELARPMAGTEGAQDPFWSPDSHALGFFSQGKLKRIDLDSGAVQVLCDVERGRGGAWSREGVILFADTSHGLLRVPSSGGTPVLATRFEPLRGDSAPRWPEFLPDGKSFLVFVWTGKPDTTGIYLSALESREMKLLQPSLEAGQFVPPDRLLFARGDILVTERVDLERARPIGEPEALVRQVDAGETSAFLRLFSASQNGIVAYRDAGTQRPLVWFDRQGKVAGRPTAVAASFGLSLSPDESLVAYSSGTLSASDVWILDLKRDVPMKLTSGPHANFPLFSRDGRFVYYRVLGAQIEVRRRPLRGSGPEETVLEGGAAFESPQDETPDGRTLIVQNTLRNYDLWTLPVEGDRELVPLVTTEASEKAARLSPDGHWLAYTSNESARDEVYVRRFPVTQEKWQVSSRGGIWPYWRGDGKEIYYVGLDGVLMAAPVSSEQTFSIGVPESLFQTSLRVLNLGRQYVASRDGQRFLMIQPTQDPAASPINVLLNGLPPKEVR